MALTPVGKTFAALDKPLEPAGTVGNFRFIYGNSMFRGEFRDFLVNVFHLYPEDELHDRIRTLVEKHDSDRVTYVTLQSELDSIKPALGDLTYALPALHKQKIIIANQTAELLDPDRSYEGYLEIGSSGRYLDSLEERLDINGERFMVAPIAPTNSIFDIVDRGQLWQAGKFINLNKYRPQIRQEIPERSLDLVTVYIGFHHCPIDLRGEFFAAIRDSMKTGGYLIVRDHDARDEKMLRIVALAHDVFNMGTNETWVYNEAELRNFYSLATLDSMLEAAGFKSNGRQLLQEGDPTLNALMVYRKV